MVLVVERSVIVVRVVREPLGALTLLDCVVSTVFTVVRVVPLLFTFVSTVAVGVVVFTAVETRVEEPS